MGSFQLSSISPEKKAVAAKKVVDPNWHIPSQMRVLPPRSVPPPTEKEIKEDSVATGRKNFSISSHGNDYFKLLGLPKVLGFELRPGSVEYLPISDRYTDSLSGELKFKMMRCVCRNN